MGKNTKGKRNTNNGAIRSMEWMEWFTNRPLPILNPTILWAKWGEGKERKHFPLPLISF